MLSAGANIAEGVSRFSIREKARFIEISFGSLMEVIHFLNVAERLGYIDKETKHKTRTEALMLSNKIKHFTKD